MILDSDGQPMVAVLVTMSNVEADVVQSMLRAEGIEAVLESRIPRHISPSGEIKVLIRSEEAEEARRLIAECKGITDDGIDVEDGGFDGP